MQRILQLADDENGKLGFLNRRRGGTFVRRLVFFQIETFGKEALSVAHLCRLVFIDAQNLRYVIAVQLEIS